jgi:periplasmic protein TonB
MPIDQSRRRARFWAGVLVAAIEVALGYALFSSRAAAPSIQVSDTMMTIRPMPVVPPPEIVPARQPRTARTQGAAAPPNLRAHATTIVAPPPVLPPIPVPVVTAPRAGQGPDAFAGASAVAGPGTGAGGTGNGSGSGGDGEGDGGGDTPPRQIKGRLKNSDYPAAAGEAGVSGTVSVRYVVETDGRVSACEITRSSGSRILDETTCRLIRERFRFRPSLDAQGRPVAAAIVENHSWYVRHEDAPPDQPR